jgi:hypothetical protein
MATAVSTGRFRRFMHSLASGKQVIRATTGSAVACPTDGGVPTQPARGATLETEAGWAFFNVNGYLGTVTAEGEVIVEDDFDEE